MKTAIRKAIHAVMILVALVMVGCTAEEDPQNGGGNDDGGGGNGGGNTPAETLINGHEYVDLGLPSGNLWATCNVGAERPEDYGHYLAWGELQPKETYDQWGYVHGCYYMYGQLDYNDRFTLAKYCDQPSYGYHGFADSLSVLEPDDDAAAATWGGGWHMPSHDEFFELFAHCGWSATTQNGVKGLKVSASNGNSLFLPAAGYKVFQMLYQEAEGEGFYWINQTHWNNPMKAWSLFFDPNTSYFPLSPNTEGELFHAEDRTAGFTLRPVHAALSK